MASYITLLRLYKTVASETSGWTVSAPVLYLFQNVGRSETRFLPQKGGNHKPCRMMLLQQRQNPVTAGRNTYWETQYPKTSGPRCSRHKALLSIQRKFGYIYETNMLAVAYTHELVLVRVACKVCDNQMADYVH